MPDTPDPFPLCRHCTYRHPPDSLCSPPPEQKKSDIPTELDDTLNHIARWLNPNGSSTFRGPDNRLYVEYPDGIIEPQYEDPPIEIHGPYSAKYYRPKTEDGVE